MALCVTLNQDGTLTPTGQPVGECTGYVLVSGSEYGVYQVVQDALGTPTPEQAMGWFFGAWGAVMVFYIASRAAGAVIAMFK
ncbi:hypothetical protein KK141_19450 [Dyella sp. LX-66]|uniref:hypothetical protein n=1 Tax=unclassified Dyella TaxID=2634549 RepID=UPI001BE058CE|nr:MULTISPECIES: hypothetical protein [unclassified Dyella]MBT2119551.1 hypothetical protein [Dyella sp. LX-1]MBT2141733.1 hypothetical protein [Dyella sp. LX-66]